MFYHYNAKLDAPSHYGLVICNTEDSFRPHSALREGVWDMAIGQFVARTVEYKPDTMQYTQATMIIKGKFE